MDTTKMIEYQASWRHSIQFFPKYFMGSCRSPGIVHTNPTISIGRDIPSPEPTRIEAVFGRTMDIDTEHHAFKGGQKSSVVSIELAVHATHNNMQQASIASPSGGGQPSQ